MHIIKQNYITSLQLSKMKYVIWRNQAFGSYEKGWSWQADPDLKKSCICPQSPDLTHQDSNHNQHGPKGHDMGTAGRLKTPLPQTHEAAGA